MIAPNLPSLHSERRKAYYQKPTLGFALSWKESDGRCLPYSKHKAAAVTFVRCDLYI